MKLKVVGGWAPMFYKVIQSKMKKKPTNFFRKWNQWEKKFFSKRKNFSNDFLKSTCSFYFGFVIGNLFGTFLNFLRNKIFWDGMILLIIISFLELINFFIYNTKHFRKSIFKLNYRKILIVFKNFQIGTLFGLFIDAFKVGS